MAQHVADTSPAITFHFSNGIGTLNTKGGGDTPLGTECTCSLQANLVQIPPCDTIKYLAKPDGKGTVPQVTPCCCVDLSLQTSCPDQRLCGFDVTFDNNNFNPVCSICSLPPGWGWSQDDQGVFHFNYTGADCNGAIIPGAPPVHFQFCGYNSDQQIGYTVCGYYCTQDPSSGNCVGGGLICCRHFYSTVNCGMAGAQTGLSDIPFSVDDGFPNPTRRSIRFDYVAPSNGEIALTLVDVLGKVIRSTSDIVSEGTGSVLIGLAAAQPGSYYCIFELNGIRITRRIQIK